MDGGTSLSSSEGVVVWGTIYRLSAPDVRAEVDEQEQLGLELAENRCGTRAVRGEDLDS